MARDVQSSAAAAFESDFHFLTTTAVLPQQRTYQDTHAVVAGSYTPSLAPRAPPLPPSRLPAHSPGSSTASTPSQPRRKHRRAPLRCPHCPFVQENGRAWDLKRHARTHEGARKKLVCGRRGCKEVFSRMDAVRRHQRSRTARCTTAVEGNA
ncbi:hypothetical protein FA95DRAFT_1493681 [Auriscalpium vulgare]|uniref:Uncharacterized protein n=1 Tax=Auriscalpium vulgare TaxID=40419 RepID=A0ACB8RRS7_9AGAM|nr:hypothetical protein FA95DRAFT_1493681 [Auriscalpium vulgare]